MKISLQKALSFYLTGSLTAGECINRQTHGFAPTDQLTVQELDDCEMTKKEYEESELNNVTFKNPTLNLKANLNTVTGQMRLSGMGVINSIFSGIGAYLVSKMNFVSGLLLTVISFGASFIKNVPVLSNKYSIFSLGANSIRGSLNVLDSIFSRIGEQGSKYLLPSLAATSASLFSISRVIKGKDNKSFELPNNTISGILGRTSIHHLDSMLASKGVELSNKNHELGFFLASTLATTGLLIPKDLRTKELPWNTLEGFLAQGSSQFLKSLFSNVGNAFSLIFNNTKNVLLGTAGITLGMPLIGSLIDSIGYKIPFSALEGKVVQSIFHAPEAVAFNLGNIIANSAVGIPLALSLCSLTYFTCVSKKGSKVLKNIEVSRDKLSGEFKRLPLFHLAFSIMSGVGVKLSNFIPAPLLTIFGPALSFQIGEKLKNIPAKFDELKGLMLRNSIHLWDSILSRSSYKTINTALKVFGLEAEESYSGNLLSDAGSTRWITEDGRIISNMALGKQLDQNNHANLLNIFLSGLGGVLFSMSAFFLCRGLPWQASNRVNALVGNHAIDSKSIKSSQVLNYPQPRIIKDKPARAA